MSNNFEIKTGKRYWAYKAPANCDERAICLRWIIMDRATGFRVEVRPWIDTNFDGGVAYRNDTEKRLQELNNKNS